jgi:hypothetical protein
VDDINNTLVPESEVTDEGLIVLNQFKPK